MFNSNSVCKNRPLIYQDLKNLSPEFLGQTGAQAYSSYGSYDQSGYGQQQSAQGYGQQQSQGIIRNALCITVILVFQWYFGRINTVI